MTLLRMKKITKRFNGIPANDRVSLEVKQGEIHALLGENGAGKTTLMNMLYGLYQPDEGEIQFAGQAVQINTPKDAMELGIGMVHQHFMLVPTLTVLENMILGLKPKGYPFVNKKHIANEINQLAEAYGLPVNLHQKVSALSVGEQQKVEILKILYRKAKLIILDEPTAVLTPQETNEFFSILKKLKGEGHSIIIITHRMSEIMEISDRVTILRGGKQVAALSIDETNPEELSMHMIGRQLESTVKKEEKSSQGKVLVKIRNLSLKEKQQLKLKEINLDLHRGEILGIAGVDGNGQNELAEIIAGVRKTRQGELFYEGEAIGSLNVKQRFQKGIAYVPDDRHKDGLVMNLDVQQNSVLRCYKKAPFSKFGVLNQQAIAERTKEAIEQYDIKTPSAETRVRLLSGGNQQKIILAREINEDPELLVVCQPTRGLDIGATETIHELLIGLRNQGKCVLLISADLEEILALSDRIGVMFGGRIAGIVNNDAELDVQQIGALMGGQQQEVRQSC